MIFSASVRPLEFLEAKVESYTSPASSQEYHWVWVDLKGGRICFHAGSKQKAEMLAAAIEIAMVAGNSDPETTDWMIERRSGYRASGVESGPACGG